MAKLQLAEALNVEAFGRWLELKNPREHVGLGCSSEGCPVACYLRDLGFDRAVVNGFAVGAIYAGGRMVGSSVVGHPEWLGVFVFKIDERAREGPVTAALAAKTLKEITNKKAEAVAVDLHVRIIPST